MSKPPIKAFKAVQQYCKKTESCKGCPLFEKQGHVYYFKCECVPSMWEVPETRVNK